MAGNVLTLWFMITALASKLFTIHVYTGKAGHTKSLSAAQIMCSMSVQTMETSQYPSVSAGM